jgi:hypothetical protein
MYLTNLKTLAVTAIAATAFIWQPTTAEARPKHKDRHGYHKHYKKHDRHSYYRHDRRHWSRGRDVYRYGPRHYRYYGPRYYTPHRRSGFNLYLDL